MADDAELVAAVIILLHIVEARIAEVHNVFSDSALGEDTSTCRIGKIDWDEYDKEVEWTIFK